MTDNRDLSTEDLHTRVLEIVGEDPSDRMLWEEHHLEIFELATSTMEPRHQRTADRWEAERKRAFVMKAFNYQFFQAGPQVWPLETRVFRSLRVSIRNQF